MRYQVYWSTPWGHAFGWIKCETIEEANEVQEKYNKMYCYTKIESIELVAI